MPDTFGMDDLMNAVNTIRGVEQGNIDPESVTLPEPEGGEPPVDNTPASQPKEEEPKVDEPKGETTDPKGEESKTEDDKKVQTPEENAKFAAERRQKELDEKVQAELQKRLAEDPAFQAAKLLEEQYGMKPEQFIEMIRQQEMMEKAQQTGKPIEDIQREYQQTQQQTDLERKNAELELKLWQSEVRVESAQLKQEMPFLTDEQLQEAVDYMLNDLKTTNIPLKRAVMALHGEAILENIQSQAKNEVLAEKSGRKTPVVPQGGKTPSTPTLNDAEKHFAQIFGMSDEDYIKYQNN